jgi:outer membrane protein TolC
MTRRILALLLWITTATSAMSHAQTRLTLADAIARARSQNPDARAAEIAEREALTRVDQARAGYFPRVDFSEAWQRGNQPVFVFGSLLAQRRFTESNFAIAALNHPDPVSNHRGALTLGQVAFDGGMTRAGVRSAHRGVDAAAIMKAQAARDLAVTATEAFGQVLMADAFARAAAAAVETAEDDATRARQRREAGLVTDADVLALDVHLAQMREQRIRAEADARVARARLNQVMGAPLDERFELDGTLAPPEASAPAAVMEDEAVRGRPEVRLAAIQVAVAENARTMARAAFLPQVGLQGGWEWNGHTFADRASSWFVGAEVRVNLFHGLADRARLAEANETIAKRRVELEKAESLVRLDVRATIARLEAARARTDVGRAAVAQAREAQRIVRDRYENGMADVTALLRAANAVLQADAQDVAARVEVLLQTAALDRALGR